MEIVSNAWCCSPRLFSTHYWQDQLIRHYHLYLRPRLQSNWKAIQKLAIQLRSRYHERHLNSNVVCLCQVSEVKAKLELSLFSDFRLTIREVDVTPARTSAVCIVLLLALGESERESRAHIRALLWPDAEPKRANENLRQSLYYLRRLFETSGFDGLTVSRTHVSLDRSKVSSDADQLLTEIIEQGRVPQRLLDTPDIADSYLKLFIEQSDTFGGWLTERQEAYQGKLQESLHQLLERSDLADEQRRQCTTLLLSQNPADEIACRAFMRLCVARGETAEALRSYNALWNHLEQELDVEPSEQTQSLAVAIKLGETGNHATATEHARTQPENAAKKPAIQSLESGVASQKLASLLIKRDSSVQQLATEGRRDELWKDIESHVEEQLLTEHHGSLISNENDCIVLTFKKTRTAVEAALSLHNFATTRYAAQAAGDASVAPPLRIAIDSEGEAVRSDQTAEPATAHLISLANRGEIITSVEVRDQITHTVDANIEDLGDHSVANTNDPVRAYRIHAPLAEKPVIAVQNSLQKSRSLLPTIAVIPPSTYTANDGMFGEILADEMIAVLSVAQEVNIVSRLSSRVFQDRDSTAGEIGSRLQANYIVSGRYREIGNRLLLDIELTDTRTEQVIWNERVSGTMTDFISPDHHLIQPLTSKIIGALMNFELQQALDAPLPTLESYTLLVSAITLMNRLSLQAFDRSKEILEHLIERVPHHSEPYAWLGKWHVLRVQQGWSTNPLQQGHSALHATEKALALNPNSSLAHTIRGLVNTMLLRQFPEAERNYETALQANPNQSLAWILKGCLHAFRGEGTPAIEHALHAIHLTPLDPLRYLYDSLAGTAALAAHQYADAQEFADRSLKVNRTHTSTLRLLAVAQWNLDKQEDAKNTALELLRLEPDFSVNTWIERSPSADYPIGDEWARTLRQVGLPD